MGKIIWAALSMILLNGCSEEHTFHKNRLDFTSPGMFVVKNTIRLDNYKNGYILKDVDIYVPGEIVGFNSYLLTLELETHLDSRLKIDLLHNSKNRNTNFRIGDIKGFFCSGGAERYGSNTWEKGSAGGPSNSFVLHDCSFDE